MTPYEQFRKECEEEIISQDQPILWQKTHDWMFADGTKKYSHHFEWMGRPIIQLPQDIYSPISRNCLENKTRFDYRDRNSMGWFSHVISITAFVA
jgi:hypothetical protein